MTLDDIVAASQPAIVRKEIDGKVYFLRPLTGAGREAYLRYVRDTANFTVPGIALFGLCDESGNVLGDPFNADHRAKIGSCDGQLTQTLADYFLDISGLTQKAVDEAEKKLSPSPRE
jgi:hypothetical protein